MKFVFFGYDFMLPSALRLIDDGHELLAAFSFECDQIFNFNHETRALTEKLGVPFIMDKCAPHHIDEFLGKGAEVFLAAGYPYKIPPVPKDKAYALNFHPALLPKGRGIMPTPFIIMDAPEAAGYSIHKMTQDFDAGDILYQEALSLTPCESVETLSARIGMRAPEALSKVMTDLPGYWQKAAPQDENQATHFPLPSEDMRLLDFTGPVEQIDKTVRAFGRFGSIAQIEGHVLAVFQCEVWKEAHDYTPGAIAVKTSREITMACQNGFACLKEFQVLDGN